MYENNVLYSNDRTGYGFSKKSSSPRCCSALSSFLFLATVLTVNKILGVWGRGQATARPTMARGAGRSAGALLACRPGAAPLSRGSNDHPLRCCGQGQRPEIWGRLRQVVASRRFASLPFPRFPLACLFACFAWKNEFLLRPPDAIDSRPVEEGSETPAPLP